MIPAEIANCLAFVGFALSILGLPIYYGHTKEES